MIENFYSGSAHGNWTTSKRRVISASSVEEKRSGATRHAPRAIRGVFEWIDAADDANRVWARNALVAIATGVALLLLAMRVGLLSP